jgi:hypothetical protein
MKIDAHKLGVTGAATSAIFYTVCSIWMYFSPDGMVNLSAALFHLQSFGPLTPFFDINAQIFVSGVVQTAVYSYIYAYLFAYVYNYISKKR